MKNFTNQEDVKKLNFYTKMMMAFFIVAVIFTLPLISTIRLYALIPYIILWGISMFFACKIEKIKKTITLEPTKIY